MYDHKKEVRRLLDLAIRELKAQGKNWDLGDFCVAEELDPTNDRSYWGTSVRDQATGEVRGFRFEFQQSDGSRINIERETIAEIKRAIRSAAPA